MDAATGRARWSFQEKRDPTGIYGDEIWAPVAVTPRNELVFTSNLGWIRKLDPASGAELVADAWPVAPARRANGSASPLAGDPIVFSAPLVDAAGTVYVAAENWFVYAFAADGAAAWRNCDFCSWGSAGMVLLADGTLLLGADLPSPGRTTCPGWRAGCQPPGGLAGKEGHVVSLNRTTGARLWAADIPGMNTFVCDEQMLNVLDDGTILISGGTHGGGVFAFAGASGVDAAAPTAKYGVDAMLTGARLAR